MGRRRHSQMKFMRCLSRCDWCLCLLLHLLLFPLERFDWCLAIDEICRSVSLQIYKVRGLSIVAHTSGLIHSYSLLFELLYISHVHVVNAWRLLYWLSHWIAFLMAGPLSDNFKDLTTFTNIFLDYVFGRSLFLKLWLNLWRVLFADNFYIKIWDWYQTISMGVLRTLFLFNIYMSDCFKSTRVHRLLCCL